MNLILLKDKINKWLTFEHFVQALAVILFCVHMAQMYVDYAIDWKQVFNGPITIFMVMLRWSSIVAAGFLIITPFYKGRTFNLYSSILGPTVGILNLVFYKYNMKAWGASVAVPWRSTLFIIEQVILIVIGLYQLFIFIKNKRYKELKPLRCFAVLIGMYAAFLYQPVFSIFIGERGGEATDFSIEHIMMLVLIFTLIILGNIVMNNKTRLEKKAFFSALVISGIMNWFYWGYGSLGSLPFHLCHTALFIMFIAFIFNVKDVFYFTYFVNVIGALFAVILPDTNTDFYSLDSVRYWMNHIYDIVIPILGVSLKFFPRPTIKFMGKAIGVFTAYFILVIGINAWFSNYHEVDFFFINSEFFFEQINIEPTLMYNYMVTLQYKDLVFRLYPLFYLVVYVGFIALMFLMWFIYDSMYHVADAHHELHVKKKILKQQYVDIKKLLNGRSLEEPIYEEGKDMIEIKNFTKRYSGANKPSVENFSLTVEGGEVFGFLGHNGAGKSTTIKAIVGIHSITDGKIYVDGYDVEKQPVEAKLRIGYVSDNHAVYEKLTGREYINYIADLYMVPQKERDERLEKYAAMFKLTHAIDKEIKSYSHGMKQKIVVIASLIHDPKVWILDEPLTGLDPTSSYQIKECMKEHAARGNIVFFSSHVIEVVEKVCTKICIINGGKLQCIYSLKELKEKGISLEELYLKYVTNGEKFRDVQEA